MQKMLRSGIQKENPFPVERNLREDLSKKPHCFSGGMNCVCVAPNPEIYMQQTNMNKVCLRDIKSPQHPCT